MGDWWIAYDHELLGYYPASLFKSLNGPACKSTWYGEVFIKDPQNNPAANAEMGSGMSPAEADVPNVAYLRDLKQYDPYWVGLEPNDDSTLWMTPSVPSCYTRSTMSNGVIKLGGRGRGAPGCLWPSQ